MNSVDDERFDRTVRFLGREGQEKLRAASVAVVGIGGIGTHVVQQLALLGVGRLVLIDSEELERSNLNRYIGARHDDPMPGTLKVALGERTAHSIDPQIQVEKIANVLISRPAFTSIIGSDYVFGCLDNDGSRLVLNEVCAAYERTYLDLATDIVPGQRLQYGGRVSVSWDGNGCVMCQGLVDIARAQEDLLNAVQRRQRDAIYGVNVQMLTDAGPSVVSLNGVVASLGVTEFVVLATGLRSPTGLSTYHADTSKVTVSVDPVARDCYYCKEVRSKGDAADVWRYIRETETQRSSEQDTEAMNRFSI